MAAPFLILLGWCLLLPAVCGLGFLAARTLPGPAEPIGFSPVFWLGIAAASAIAIVWHFFLPLDGRVWLVLAPAAAAGLILEGRGHRAEYLRSLRTHAPWCLLLLAFALWLAARASLPAECADDHLYYTQTVRWNALYPAVPGIGNLHPLLAFNHAYHLLVAAFGVGPFASRGDRLANGLLLLAVVAPCSRGLVRLLGAKPAPADALAALLLAPALDFSLRDELSCPAADFAVYMAGAGLLLSALEPVLDGTRPGTRRITALVAACAGAVILKPSLVCVAFPMALLVLARGMTGASRPERIRLLRAAVLISAAAALPWMAHGIVLSGYPLFPAAAPDLGVSWRMDPEVIIRIHRWVHAFARWPGHPDAEVTASTAWVGKWFEREWLNNRTFLFPSALAVSGAIALLAAYACRRRPPHALLIALAPVALGLTTWWILAPDLRFAGPLLWAAADLLALAALLAWRPGLDRSAQAAIAAFALILAAGAFIGTARLLDWRSDFPPLHHNHGTTRARLASGETIDVAGNAGCWDPPCGSPPIDPRLRLRKAGDWRSGFTLEPVPASASRLLE